MLPVKFTKFESTSGAQTKKFSLGEDGISIKLPSDQMRTGFAHNVECDFSAFPAILDACQSNEAFGYGTYDTEAYGDTVRIVTAKQAQPPLTIARTKQYFSYANAAGVVMLDHDPSPYVPRTDSKELLGILSPIHPAIAESAVLVRASVSTGVSVEGSDPAIPSKGFHAYLPVLNASDIPRYGDTLFKRLWLEGYGVIALSSSGAMLPRTLIDNAVFSPERLDFVGAPIVGEGLAYTPPVADYKDGEYLDTATLPSLTEQEETRFNELVAEAKEAIKPQSEAKNTEWIEAKVPELIAKGMLENDARAQLAGIAKGTSQTLPLGLALHFTIHGSVTVAEVLANPLKYDGQTLADPIEGVAYGSSTAKFFYNNGQPIIHSFAHGQKNIYTLQESATFALLQKILAEAKKLIHGVPWRYSPEEFIALFWARWRAAGGTAKAFKKVAQRLKSMVKWALIRSRELAQEQMQFTADNIEFDLNAIYSQVRYMAGVHIVRAGHGAGKTNQILVPLVTSNKNALVISNRVSLIADIVSRCNSAVPDSILGYQDFDPRYMAIPKAMAICVNSITNSKYQANTAEPKVVIIDEAARTCQDIFST